MDVTYDYYRIFYYVAKYKSLSHAAEILHSNQPNISKFMNKLEAQLGCRLMIRSNKGVRLTPEGERLFSHVAVAYDQLREAETELAGDRELSSGIVRIGATETALHGILLNVLTKFRAMYPGVKLMIANYSTPQAVDAIKKGTVDFAIVTTPTGVMSDFREIPLLNFKEILIASSTSAYGSIRSLSPGEIVKYPVVGLGRHSMTYEFYTELFLRYGLEWQPDIDAATADQLYPMIKAGLGIGFVPEFMVRDAIRDGEIREIKVSDMNIVRELVLIEEIGQRHNIAAETLRRLLCAANG